MLGGEREREREREKKKSSKWEKESGGADGAGCQPLLGGTWGGCGVGAMGGSQWELKNKETTQPGGRSYQPGSRHLLPPAARLPPRPRPRWCTDRIVQADAAHLALQLSPKDQVRARPWTRRSSLICSTILLQLQYHK